MSLTDPHLVFLLAGLSLFAVVLVVLLWRRMSGSKFRHIFGRITSLITINVLVIATIGAALNNYGAFYGSWGELLGRQYSAPLMVDQSGDVITAKDLENATFTDNGTAIIYKLVRGESAGLTSRVIVALPPSYVSALKNGIKPRNDYRVVQFFPGYPGHEISWIKVMKVLDRMDEAMRAGKMTEIVAVFPHINIFPRFDAECMNIPGGPQIETWISRDIVNYINTWLNLTPRKWAAVGYSAGGWCASMLAIRHPDQYSLAASIAGYYKPEIATQITGESRKQLRSEYDLYGLIAAKPPAISLFIVNPLADPFSNEATLNFLSQVKPPMEVTRVDLPGAGHNLRAWKQVLPSMLEWIDSGFKNKVNE